MKWRKSRKGMPVKFLPWIGCSLLALAGVSGCAASHADGHAAHPAHHQEPSCTARSASGLEIVANSVCAEVSTTTLYAQTLDGGPWSESVIRPSGTEVCVAMIDALGDPYNGTTWTVYNSPGSREAAAVCGVLVSRLAYSIHHRGCWVMAGGRCQRAVGRQSAAGGWVRAGAAAPARRLHCAIVRSVVGVGASLSGGDGRRFRQDHSEWQSEWQSVLASACLAPAAARLRWRSGWSGR